jgi:hypothetical protein
MAKTATKSQATTTKAPIKGSRTDRTKQVKIKKVSRAVTRLVEPGSQVDCMHCDERVKFQAKMRHLQVICNVYQKNQWLRVEHFHADCYKLAKRPFGKPID